MPVFLQGRRAFLSSLRRRHRRCNPLSVHRVTNSGLAYPRRAYSCRACPAAAAVCHSYSHLASHAAAACHSYPHLASPAAAAACHSFPHFAYFAAAALGYRSAARTATPPAWSEMPPRTASLLQFCPEHHHPEAPHGLRMFSCPAGSTDTARAPSAVLRDVAQPIPVPALPGAQKRRTEPHRGPSAAKKQPICHGSITAAALQPVRSVHAPETDPFRIVRAGISG